MMYRLKELFVNFKYSLLKFMKWRDAYHSGLINWESGGKYDVYIYGKRFKNCRIRKFKENVAPPEGVCPYYVELEDGCTFHIVSPDMVLFLPWAESKSGRRYLKEREKTWSTPR